MGNPSGPIRLVQKFGGTSVADVPHLQAVAAKVAQEVRQGHKVAVVVSAMAGVTNQLAEYTRQISSLGRTNYHDVVLSSGEQVTTGLLALALHGLHIPATAFMGWQIPILTDSSYTNATITNIDATRLEASWAEGIVPVVAGFQGISPEGKLTTLGRGGSDITAVALAASLKADRCEIYTDVAGVYTADPRIVPSARKLTKVTYDEMLELAIAGAKVLHWRSVATAKAHQVNLRVLSAFLKSAGTEVVGHRHFDEDSCVSGVALNEDMAQIIFPIKPSEWPDSGGQGLKAAEQYVQAALVKQAILAEMFTSRVITPQLGTLSFVVSHAELEATKKALARFTLEINTQVARVAVVGYGLPYYVGIVGAFFQVLREHGIKVKAAATSHIKVSALIDRAEAIKALVLLHSAYGLDDLTSV